MRNLMATLPRVVLVLMLGLLVGCQRQETGVADDPITIGVVGDAVLPETLSPSDMDCCYSDDRECHPGPCRGGCFRCGNNGEPRGYCAPVPCPSLTP